jgi:cullin-4
MPPDVHEQMERFDSYYRNKHTGRVLTWKHSLAHCVVKSSFPKGTKELAVSAFQAVILLLFNDAEKETLSYAQISRATGLTGQELDRALQSLACGKVRVLTKHPKGKEIKATDTFSVNLLFSDPKYKVKINQIQMRESKEETKTTHDKIIRDRKLETQAAIVRIMKSRKQLAHAVLVAEVIQMTRKRGAVDAAEIKVEIERFVSSPFFLYFCYSDECCRLWTVANEL